MLTECSSKSRDNGWLGGRNNKKVYNTYVEHRDKVDIFHVSFSGGKTVR